MFRELTRKRQQLTAEECLLILKEEKRGVLSVIGDDGYPYGMPMNHWYNEDDGKLYFHCGKVGHRADALRRDPRVSFCVYDGGYRNDGEWALNIRSVIVFGTVEVVEDAERIAHATAMLSRKFTDDEAYIAREIAQYAANTALLVLTPAHICGKLVNEA